MGQGAGDLPLVGGAVCLDFVNTVDWRATGRPQEWLRSYGDLLAWGKRAGLIGGDRHDFLVGEAARRPGEAAAALALAIRWREAIHGIFRAFIDGKEPGRDELALFNEGLAESLGAPRLVWTGQGYRWEWGEDASALHGLLRPVMRSAADLLVSAELARVKVCSWRGCGWLFLDTSRNKTRKWCSMASCGNRAKARRYYARAAGR